MHILANEHFPRARAILAAGILAATLSACGTTNWGFPYRATVQQGNWITTGQIAQLEVGMSRDQVRFILGTPTLQDALHADRWDYPYFNQPGYGTDELRKFTVWFDGDQLVRWEGDQQPDRQPFQKADSGKEAIAAQRAGQADETQRDGDEAREGTATAGGAAPSGAAPAAGPAGPAPTDAAGGPQISTHPIVTPRAPQEE